MDLRPTYRRIARWLGGAVGGVALVAMVAAAGVPDPDIDITALGGDLTRYDLPGRHIIQVNAPNIASEERRLRQLAGFGVFHRFFTAGQGLGPNFVNASCGGCHVDNGRGPLRFTRSPIAGTTMVVKVSRRGLNEDGSPKDVRGVGSQLQDHAVSGRRKMSGKLRWRVQKGRYPDGTRYKLRRPLLSIRIRNRNVRKLVTSLRMTPAVIGPGLLEAIPDSEILALSDPNDLDGDGISGHPNFVPDVRNGGLAIGRFGFRASHPTVEQQSAGALFGDIGIANPIFTNEDESIELNEEELDLLTIYQKVAGVPPARNQDDPQVIAGKLLFQQVGCDSCHRMTMTTGSYPDPELENQTFHPFTDLLLHDMGRGLADRRSEFSASGTEWRTTPLWGLGFSRELAGGRTFFLHDGRARSIEEAILWHGGEGAASRRAFKELAKEQREQLLLFLDSL